MSQQQLLTTLVDVLNRSGIEYMLTGSLVSSLQGEPRSTHDIDVVVSIKSHDVAKLSTAFLMPQYYFEPEMAMQAIRDGGMFNLIDGGSGDKVDFWILTSDEFDRSRFERRRREEVLGVQMFVSQPEDTILAKLRWSLLSGGSEKQFRDALRVYEVQVGSLNMEYLERWVSELQVTELWTRLKNEAMPLRP